MIAVYKRELRSLMTGLYGPLFAAILLLIYGIVMYGVNMVYGLADVSYNLAGYAEYALILLIPLLSMKVMTPDIKKGTLNFYLSLPLRNSDIVLGKFFACLTVLGLPTMIISLYPLLLSAFGKVNLLGAYVSIISYFLLAAALLALCMFLASLTKYFFVSILVGLPACALLFFLPKLALYLPDDAVITLVGFLIFAILLAVIAWFATKSIRAVLVTVMVTVIPTVTLYVLDTAVFHWEAFEGLLYVVLTNLSPFYQFEYMIQNTFLDLFSVAVWLAYTVLFLFLAVLSTDSRRRA